MTRITRATLRASSAAAVALALAACSDSTTTNTMPTADQAVQTGEFIATEVAGATSSLMAGDAMNSSTSATFARSAAPFTRTVSPFRASTASTAECGTWTPATPADADGDGIYDDLTVTFTLPDCHTTDINGNSIDLTGSLHLQDATPTAAGLGFSLSLTNIKVQITDVDHNTFSVTRNGTGSVTATTDQLTQAHNFVTTVAALGISARLTTNWSSTFTAAQGSTITQGQPLPDGTFTPGGTTEWVQGHNHFTFTLSTTTPLAYSAACAADAASDNPFSSGALRADLSSTRGSGYVEIVFSGCAAPTITYHPTSA
jgi:hypothetical protein